MKKILSGGIRVPARKGSSLRRLLKGAAILGAALLFAACAGGAAQTGADEAESEGAAVKTVYGEISEVIGNAIIIKEMERPEVFEISDGAGLMRGIPEGATEFTLPDGTVVPIGEDGRPDMSGVDMTALREAAGERILRGEGRTGDGPVTSFGGNPDAPFEGRSGSTAEGGPQRRVMERAYTGEEIEVVIPVGLSVMTRVRSGDGLEEKELPLTALQSGNMITVTYKEDGKTIDTVFVSQTQTAAGGMPDGMAFPVEGFYMAVPASGADRGAAVIGRAP